MPINSLLLLSQTWTVIGTRGSIAFGGLSGGQVATMLQANFFSFPPIFFFIMKQELLLKLKILIAKVVWSFQYPFWSLLPSLKSHGGHWPFCNYAVLKVVNECPQRLLAGILYISCCQISLHRLGCKYIPLVYQIFSIKYLIAKT